MKYCVDYYNNFRYNDIIDEIVIYFKDYKENIFKAIRDQSWKEEQRIIIDIADVPDSDLDWAVTLLIMTKKEHNNIAARISLEQKQIKNELKERNIPYFFIEKCTAMDAIYGMIKLGASDIYVAESLAFNLKDIKKYYQNINIRVIPNIAQYTIGFKKYIPDPYKFFVRPEDTDNYEPYVDTFEIIASEDRLSVLYEIYKNKQWAGDLSQLIVGLIEPFYNTSLVPMFGTKRVNCGQKCMIGQCDLCKQMKDISNDLHDINLEFEVPKDKEWKNETRSYEEIVRFVEKTTANGDGEVSKG